MTVCPAHTHARKASLELLVQVVPVPPPHEPLACRYLVVTEGGRTGRKVSFVELPESLSRLLLAVSCLVRKGQRAVCLININLTCGSVTAADDPAASRQAVTAVSKTTRLCMCYLLVCARIICSRACGQLRLPSLNQ
jgi:hypothetical protein